MSRRPGWRLGCALALALAGIASTGQAAWIHAKARLGQALIAGAWERMQRGDEAARPWAWADTWPVARLRVPDLDVDVFVLSGGTGGTLAWGPGHLAGTARVGGPGNAVVAGHRDTHFAFLRAIEIGDEIHTESASGARRVYRVTRRFVTDARDASVLAEAWEGSRLTLVTCWPFDAPLPGGPGRFVVVAESGTRGSPRSDRVLPPHADPEA